MLGGWPEPAAQTCERSASLRRQGRRVREEGEEEWGGQHGQRRGEDLLRRGDDVLGEAAAGEREEDVSNLAGVCRRQREGGEPDKEGVAAWLVEDDALAMAEAGELADPTDPGRRRRQRGRLSPLHSQHRHLLRGQRHGCQGRWLLRRRRPCREGVAPERRQRRARPPCERRAPRRRTAAAQEFCALWQSIHLLLRLLRRAVPLPLWETRTGGGEPRILPGLGARCPRRRRRRRRHRRARPGEELQTMAQVSRVRFFFFL